MTEATQTQAEYTGMGLAKTLGERGYPLTYTTVIENIIPMLRDLELVRVVDVSKPTTPSRQIRNMVSEDTVTRLCSYLRARQEQGLTRMPHSAHTWKMLVNLGYMQE